MIGNNRHILENIRISEWGGFTLVELMVVLILSAIITAAIYGTFPAHQKVSMEQDRVALMQQQLRGAMSLMAKEIRMAGYNPQGAASACTPGFVTIDSSNINFTLDKEQDGDCDDNKENITYKLATVNGKPCIRRKSSAGGTFQTIAENIEVLNFVYRDENGTQTANPADVRSVEITLIARTEDEDPKYQDNNTYYNQQGNVILASPGDGYRRRVLTTTVQCRNLGL